MTDNTDRRGTRRQFEWDNIMQFEYMQFEYNDFLDDTPQTGDDDLLVIDDRTQRVLDYLGHATVEDIADRQKMPLGKGHPHTREETMVNVVYTRLTMVSSPHAGGNDVLSHVHCPIIGSSTHAGGNTDRSDHRSDHIRSHPITFARHPHTHGGHSG